MTGLANLDGGHAQKSHGDVNKPHRSTGSTAVSIIGQPMYRIQYVAICLNHR